MANNTEMGPHETKSFVLQRTHHSAEEEASRLGKIFPASHQTEMCVFFLVVISLFI